MTPQGQMNGNGQDQGGAPTEMGVQMSIEDAIAVMEEFGIKPEDVPMIVMALEAILNEGEGDDMAGPDGDEPEPAEPPTPRQAAPQRQPAPPQRLMPPQQQAPAPDAPAPMEAAAPPPKAPRQPSGNPLIDLANIPPQPNQPLPLDQKRKPQKPGY